MENRKDFVWTAALLLAIFLVAFAVFGLMFTSVKDNLDKTDIGEEGCRYCLADHGIKTSNESLSPSQIEMCRNCEPIPWDDLAP